MVMMIMIMMTMTIIMLMMLMMIVMIGLTFNAIYQSNENLFLHMKIENIWSHAI